MLDEFETKIDLNIDAFIPPSYIRNESQKLNTYKRIACISTEDEYMDMQDELIDRYGDIPKKVMNLLAIALVKSMAHKAWITEIANEDKILKIYIYKDAKIDTMKIPDFIDKYNGKMRFVTDIRPYFAYQSDKKISDMEEYRKVLTGIIAEIKDLSIG